MYFIAFALTRAFLLMNAFIHKALPQVNTYAVSGKKLEKYKFKILTIFLNYNKFNAKPFIFSII